MTGMTIEWAPFRLKDNATEAELMAASAELQSGFLEKQPGFVRRELLRGPDGLWCDLLHWTDAASASAAMEQAMQNPACARYFELITGVDSDDPGAGLLHFEVRDAYEAAGLVDSSR